MRLSRRIALLGAFVLSFATYLIPIFNVHAGWIPIGLFFASVGEPSVWTLAVVGALLAFQIVAFFLFHWVLSDLRWLKVFAVIIAAPLLVVAANWSLLYAIPVLVLVEKDSREELGSLERVCSVPDSTIAQVHSGTDLSLVYAGEAWLITEPERIRARLKMPDCQTMIVDAPKIGSTMDHVAPGGHLLYRADSGELAYFGPGLEAPMPLSSPPEISYWNPVLSDDGSTLAWLDREARQSSPRPHRLRLRQLPDGQEQIIPLDLSPSDQFELIGADTRNDRITLARYRNEILSIDLNGQHVRGPVSPAGVYDARWGFRWLGDGWVAWDGYREEGPARIVWALAAGQGEVVVPRGRGIDALSITADGSVIAASISSNVSVGSAKSAVFLVRTIDGVEIYRRYRPPYMRTRLAFLGNEHLAMTRFENGQNFVDVYRLPALGE